MIIFKKTVPETKPAATETETNRFEKIRKTAVDQHKTSDTDGAKRRERQTVEDNQIV